MPNNLGSYGRAISVQEIGDFRKHLEREDGIVIENSDRDLLQTSGIEEELPHANYILTENHTLERLKEYQHSRKNGPPIHVEFIRWSNAFERLVNASEGISEDQKPDVVQIGSTWIAFFANKGAIVDLSGRFEESDFFPPSIAAARPIGMSGIYGVPWFVDTRALFYRKDILAKTVVASWNGLFKATPSILQKNPSLRGVVGFPLAIRWDIIHNMLPFLWSWGGDVISPRSIISVPFHRVLLDSPQSIDAVLAMQNLSKENCLGFENISTAAIEKKFLSGKYAAIVTGTWFLKALPRDWKKTIDIALPPAGPMGSVPFIGGSHLAVWHAAKQRGNEVLAMDVVNFLTSRESERRFSTAAGFIPARNNVLKELEGFPARDVLIAALNAGKSPPAMADWGEIVENKLVSDELWQLWQGISQAQSPASLEGIVRSASDGIRREVKHAAWERVRTPFVIGIIFLIGIAAGIISLMRLKYRTLALLLERSKRELSRIDGERVVLNGEIIILSRREEEQSQKLSTLKLELNELDKKAGELVNEISVLKEKQRKESKAIIGEVRLSFDGRVFMDDREIAFENSGQARRLIEFVSRQVPEGTYTVSCIWGYALFEWDVSRLRSKPNRLFNTAVAKINSAFTSRGRPPLLKSEGRKSWRWRLMWDCDLLLKSSDIQRAREHAETARKNIVRGAWNEASQTLIKTLEADPKSFGAMELYLKLPSEARTILAPSVRKFVNEIKADVALMRSGARAVDKLVKDSSENDEYHELMMREMHAMRQRAEFLDAFVNSLSPDADFEHPPLYLKNIVMKLAQLRAEISELKADGVDEHEIWSIVVHSENFIGLIGIPRVQSMVNNFFNYGTKSMEDPRLVQLALILMLSHEGNFMSLDTARTEDEFFGIFKLQLKKQFQKLENHISILSVN